MKNIKMGRQGRLSTKKAEKKIASVGITLLLLITSLITVVPTATSDNPPSQVKVQLAMILDGSGSISSSEWSIMVNGLADAVKNPSCTPQDGSVELTVIQFGGLFNPHAQIEIGPTVITDTNVIALANQIENISKIGGYTPLACGIILAADTLADSPNFCSCAKQALNIVTDGEPNCCCDGYSGSGCGSSNGKDSAVDARNYAIATLEMTADQDEIDVEGVGIENENRDWLKDSIVYPQPGYIAPPFDHGRGWVRVVANYTEFANTICEKFQVVTCNYEITYLGRTYDSENDRTTYTYKVCGTGSDPELSHFTAEIPPCIPLDKIINYNPSYDVSIGTDPTLGILH